MFRCIERENVCEGEEMRTKVKDILQDINHGYFWVEVLSLIFIVPYAFLHFLFLK